MFLWMKIIESMLEDVNRNKSWTYKRKTSESGIKVIERNHLKIEYMDEEQEQRKFKILWLHIWKNALDRTPSPS
jgi:transposase